MEKQETTDMELTLKRVKLPATTGSFTGRRFLYFQKLGGEMQSINVRAAGEPYQSDYGKGRKAWYVDVFGYGWSGSVLVGKLYEIVKSSNLEEA